MEQNFTAFDFETANESPDSAIQLGIAQVRGGVVVESRSWMIRPPTMDFLPRFIDIHGIRPEQVADAPTFDHIWPEVVPYFTDSKLLVAHYATFDRGVLSATCKRYGLKLPRFKYVCSLEIARVCWPDLPRHKLNIVCDHLNIPLQHHEATSDALAAAQIVLRAIDMGYDHEAKALPERARFTITPLVVAPRAVEPAPAKPTTIWSRVRGLLGGGAV